MAKLYAEMTSDKGGRKVSKSGDKYLQITASVKNVNLWDVFIFPCGRITLVHNNVKKSFHSLNWQEDNS